MSTALNETYIGWLHENCYLVREIFPVQKMSNIFAVGQNPPPSTGFSPKIWSKGQDSLKERVIFSKVGKAEDIIQRNNSCSNF